jgi:fumarate reductase flavoprotein subunit
MEKSKTIVVVGAGNSGLPAAIVAADQGAHVVLIEKTDRVGGTLWRSSATVSGAGTRMQRAKGIVDTPEQHAADALNIGRGQNNTELVTLAAKYAGETIDWLQDIGVPFTDDSPVFAGEHELYSVPRSYRPVPIPGTSGAGRRFIPPLEREMEERRQRGQIDLRLNTRVTKLIVEDGAVRGVEVSSDGKSETIRAAAIILASGGYAANMEMLDKYRPAPRPIITLTDDIQSGECIQMAQEAGAALTHTDMMVVMPGGVEDPNRPGFCLYWVIVASQRKPAIAGDVWVNREGKRFMREDESSPDKREQTIMAQPTTEMWVVFDEPMRVGLTPEVGEYTRRQLEGQGDHPPVIVSAPTIRELAEKLGVDADGLEATVKRYNAAVAAGKDDDFGREQMPKALDTAPFHAVPTKGVILGTHGGLRANDNLQVLRADATPIEGLYAAGEVLGKGQLMGDAAVSGFACGPAFTFGRLAGRFATASLAPALAGDRS